MCHSLGTSFDKLKECCDFVLIHQVGLMRNGHLLAEAAPDTLLQVHHLQVGLFWSQLHPTEFPLSVRFIYLKWPQIDVRQVVGQHMCFVIGLQRGFDFISGGDGTIKVQLVLKGDILYIQGCS